MAEINPDVVKIPTDSELKVAGFTEGGIARFKKTVSDYALILLNRAVSFGTGKKYKDYKLEITQEDVQASAHAIADSFGKPNEPTWAVWAQVFEYILTAVAGFCAGKTEYKWGLICFIAATAIAVILFVTRQTKAK